jgi:hypothetical protein
MSNFAKRSEPAKGPSAAGSSNETSADAASNLARPAALLAQVRGWLEKLRSFVFTRYVIGFAVGIAATLAWQWYGGPARAAVAGWSPYLAWVAPAPAATSAERRKATAHALTAVRQSVDNLAAEISRQEAQSASDNRVASDNRTSAASSPSKRGSRHP